MIIDEFTRYAGFWRRVAATLIDVVLFSLLIAMLLLLLSSLFGIDMVAADWQEQPASWQFIVFNWVVPIAVTVFLWSKFAGTPGKLLLGCHIVDAGSGNKLGVRQAALRYIAYLASIVPLLLGFLWIGWDKRKQGFHDKLATTVVIVADESDKSLADLERELR